MICIWAALLVMVDFVVVETFKFWNLRSKIFQLKNRCQEIVLSSIISVVWRAMLIVKIRIISLMMKLRA